MTPPRTHPIDALFDWTLALLGFELRPRRDLVELNLEHLPPGGLVTAWAGDENDATSSNFDGGSEAVSA